MNTDRPTFGSSPSRLVHARKALDAPKDTHERLILHAIRTHGQITRADLARITGFAPSVIAGLTTRLFEQDLIVDLGPRRGRGPGQPAQRLAVNPDARFAFGVTIDRDHLTVLAVDLLGNVRARLSHEIAFALPEVAVNFVASAMESLRATLGVTLERIVGSGIAMPDQMGDIDLPHRPASYAMWSGVDLIQMLGGILPGPIHIENDAAAAAVGELQYGHGLRSPSFVYLLVNAALGGGVVINGAQYRGADGRSGEIGFLPVRSRGLNLHTLQQCVSLSALYEQLLRAGHTVTTPQDLLRLDGAGQAIVSGWIDSAADFLTAPLVSVSCLLNPNAVFIGGRVPELILDRLIGRLNDALSRQPVAVPKMAVVSRSVLGADAPAIGAASLALAQYLLPLHTAIERQRLGVRGGARPRK